MEYNLVLLSRPSAYLWVADIEYVEISFLCVHIISTFRKSSCIFRMLRLQNINGKYSF